MANNTAFNIIISSKAKKEIEKAWDWYEERKPGLGDRFIEELINCFLKIEINPDRFPKRIKNYHEAVVPVFPYLIIYTADKKNKSVRIISVFHSSLNPIRKFK